MQEGATVEITNSEIFGNIEVLYDATLTLSNIILAGNIECEDEDNSVVLQCVFGTGNIDENCDVTDNGCPP